MDKVLARYFVKLIAENLQFSFNGMGIPSYSCEWLENQLIQGNFDKVEEFIKLRYAEQNKKRIKKKHKFRAMTIGEHCTVRRTKCKDCEYQYDLFYCDYSNFNQVNRERDKNKPYKTKDGKYIFIEDYNTEVKK